MPVVGVSVLAVAMLVHDLVMVFVVSHLSMLFDDVMFVMMAIVMVAMDGYGGSVVGPGGMPGKGQRQRGGYRQGECKEWLVHRRLPSDRGRPMERDIAHIRSGGIVGFISDGTAAVRPAAAMTFPRRMRASGSVASPHAYRAM